MHKISNDKWDHPLRSVVLSAFTLRSPRHDHETIASVLCGVDRPDDLPDFPTIGDETRAASRILAADVLACLQHDGWLVRDADGWYRRRVPLGLYHKDVDGKVTLLSPGSGPLAIESAGSSRNPARGGGTP